MEFDLENMNQMSDVLNDINDDQSRKRKIKERKAWSIFSGNQAYYTERRLQELFPETHSSIRVSDINIVKKIVDTKAKSYKDSPIRKLGDDKETEAYHKIMDQVKMDRVMSTYDQRFNLQGYSCLWVNVIGQDDGEFEFFIRALGPEQFSRVVDKNGKTKLFIIEITDFDDHNSPGGDFKSSTVQDELGDANRDEERYLIWNDTQHVQVIRESKRCSLCVNEHNENNVNPLGVIPAHFDQKGDSTYLPVSSPLPDQAVEWNSCNSIRLTACDVSVFGKLVLKFPDEMDLQKVEDSLFSFIKLPQMGGDSPATEAQYIQPGSDIGAISAVLSDQLGMILSTEGLEGAAKTIKSEGQTFSSGFDHALSMSSIMSIIEENQKFFADAENAVYHLIKRWFEEAGNKTFLSDNLEVQYRKPKPLESEKEILDNIRLKKDLGIIEKHEMLMLLDPNMSEKDAKEKIERIDEEKQANMELFAGSFGGNNESEMENSTTDFGVGRNDNSVDPEDNGNVKG